MKNFFIFTFCFLILSCRQETQDDMNTIIDCACKNSLLNIQENIQENIPWLKDLINKMDTDKTGNYVGTIWLMKYQEQDIFVTDMALGSGGILYYFLNCSGNHLIFRNGEGLYCPKDYIGGDHFFVEDEEDFKNFFSNYKLDVVIYSNIPL